MRVIEKVIQSNLEPTRQDVVWIDTSDPSNPVVKIYVNGKWEVSQGDGVWEAGSGENSVQQKGTGAEASGYASVAESKSISLGQQSHSEGIGTVARNLAEHAEGSYNVSHRATTTYGNPGNTQHSVGIGTEGANKNAFEIMQNGDVYIKGVGTYDGTNPISGTNDIKTIIEANELKKQIGELTNINDYSQFLYFSGTGTGILVFTRISESDFGKHNASCYFISRSWQDLENRIEVQKIFGWMSDSDKASNYYSPGEYFIENWKSGDYGFVNYGNEGDSSISWKFYHLSGDINAVLASETVDIIEEDMYWKNIILSESSYTVATIDEIDALFSEGGGGSGSESGGGEIIGYITLSGELADGGSGTWSTQIYDITTIETHPNEFLVQDSNDNECMILKCRSSSMTTDQAFVRLLVDNGGDNYILTLSATSNIDMGGTYSVAAY